MNAPPFQTFHVPPRPHCTEHVSREETLARREKFQEDGWRPPNHKPKTKRAIACAKRVCNDRGPHQSVRLPQVGIEWCPLSSRRSHQPSEDRPSTLRTRWGAFVQPARAYTAREYSGDLFSKEKAQKVKLTYRRTSRQLKWKLVCFSKDFPY